MQLVIVESPTKAKTLKRYLGTEYSVDASMGHVRDLPKSKLGVDVENNFEPVYEVSKGKGKTVTKLVKEAGKAKTIILAMDPDREGEAIAYHVQHLISEKHKKAKLSFVRVTFHEITKEAIMEAMEHPGIVNVDLVDAQQARRVLDRLVGYNLSPVLWRKVRRGLSAGRVQSVALRMIVEREAEREAFKPQEYWDVEVLLANTKPTAISAQIKETIKEALADELQGFGKMPNMSDAGLFIAQLVEIEDKKLVIKGSQQDKGAVVHLTSKDQAGRVRDDLRIATYTVETVERKERKQQPYAPYTTSTLQQAAANTLGWSGKQTMRIAQQLYEAGMITYHRTDSLNLSGKAVESARRLIESEYGKPYLPTKPRFFKTSSKSAQEAHEAIRPTEVAKREVTGVTGTVTSRHEKLYELIWKRFVACQMMPAVHDQTTITLKAMSKKNYRLRANGSILKFDGWRKVYGKKQDMNGILPEVVEGQACGFVELVATEKQTQPPPRYNDASLVKELEKRGIGRPSTYAPIISVLEDRGYVEREERRFVPTAVGVTVVEFLVKYFAEVMDYDFTAEMEEDLDRVARGEKDWRKIMGEFWGPFEKKVKAAEDAKRHTVPVEETGRECPDPKCTGGKLVIRSGRFGKFLSCNRFPDCKYTEPLVEKLEGFVCPDCGSDVVMKRTRKGRTFWGCSSYPKCDWASWKDPRKKED
jgi:DNA topoisomerase I